MSSFDPEGTYSSLKISGPVSVRCTGDLPEYDVGEEALYPWQGKTWAGYFILLIGSTGSGKSSFIEALSRDKRLHIAKDQLESVTQDVQSYQMENVRWTHGERIFLIDTAGLSDHKISEARIFKMIHDWLKAKGISQIHRVMYFDRITDIRMSGSRWKSISVLFKALSSFDERMGRDMPNMGVVHVTTMWDTLPSEGHWVKAEARFQQLLDTIDEWHGLPQIPLYVGKFLNTAESSLQIIDLETLHLIRGWRSWVPFSEVNRFSASDINIYSSGRNDNFRQFLYQALVDRISTTRQRLDANRDFLEESNTNAGDNTELLTILRAERDDIWRDLRQILVDLRNFGTSPTLSENTGRESIQWLKRFLLTAEEATASESRNRTDTMLLLLPDFDSRTYNTVVTTAHRGRRLNGAAHMQSPNSANEVDAHSVSGISLRQGSVKSSWGTIKASIGRALSLPKSDGRKWPQ